MIDKAAIDELQYLLKAYTEADNKKEFLDRLGHLFLTGSITQTSYDIFLLLDGKKIAEDKKKTVVSTRGGC